MRVRITAVGKDDARYSRRKEIVGQTGLFSRLPLLGKSHGGFVAGTFYPDHVAPDDPEGVFFLDRITFYQVKLHHLEEEK